MGADLRYAKLRKLVNTVGVTGFILDVRPGRREGLIGRASENQRASGEEFVVLEPVAFRTPTEWSSPIAKA